MTNNDLPYAPPFSLAIDHSIAGAVSILVEKFFKKIT
jgi:hypothetical protein